MKGYLVLLIIGVLLLSACQEQQLRDNETNWTRPTIDDPDDIRPDLNRTYDPEDQPPTQKNETIIDPVPHNQSVFLVRRDDFTQFRIPLGTAFGAGYPVITMEDIHLLKPAPIQTGDGHFRGYRQYLRFAFGANSTGNVSFIVDEERNPEYVGTAMVFPEDLPIFEYALLLDSLPFWDDRVVGSNLMILGRTYQVMEATNFSLQLNGIDVPQYLMIRDGKSLETNKKKISNTAIDYDGHGFTYRFFAPDPDPKGLILREGETLRMQLYDELIEEALLGPFFDVRYDGLETIDPIDEAVIKLNGRGDNVKLEWQTAWNEADIPLLSYDEDTGLLMHGDGEHMLHLRECANHQTGCIKEDDWVVLEGRAPNQQGKPGAPTANILRLSTIDPDEGMVIFRDLDSNRISVDWVGEPGDSRHPATAKLPFLDRMYTIYIYNSTVTLANGTNASMTNRISMDLDGSGSIKGTTVDLLIVDHVRIKFDNVLNAPTDEPYNMSITIETTPFDKNQKRSSNGVLNKELLRFKLVADEGEIVTEVAENPSGTVGDQALLETPDEEFAMGITPWGSMINLDIDGHGTQQTAHDVVIELPYSQRFGLVSIGKIE